MAAEENATVVNGGGEVDNAATPAPETEKVDVVSNGVKISNDPNAETEKETETNKEVENNEKEEQAENVSTLKDIKKDIDDAKDKLTAKNIDIVSLQNEYDANGKLSENSYKVLEDAGYARNIVDAIIAGWEAKADSFYNAVINSAGGDKEYKKVTEFVKGQGNEAVDSFNSIIEHAENVSVVKNYIAGIKAQMEAKHGTANETLGGSGAKETSGYKTESEMIKAVSDVRYRTDPSYHKQVEEKIKLSSFFG